MSLFTLRLGFLTVSASSPPTSFSKCLFRFYAYLVTSMDAFKTPLEPPKKMARLTKTPLRMVNSDKDASAGMKTPDNSNHSVGITEEEGELLNKVAKTKNLAKISCSTSKKAPKEVAEDIKRIDSKKLVFATGAKFNPTMATGIPFLTKRKNTVPKPFKLTSSARKPKIN